MGHSETKDKSTVSQRKAPKQKRSLGLVDAILEAAARILSTRELDEVSTNKIAEMAGASIGSLYQYFPNKEALASAVLERILSLQIGFAKDLIEKTKDADIEEGVDIYVTYFFTHVTKHRKLFCALGKHIFRIKQFENLISTRTAVRDAIADRLQKQLGIDAVRARNAAWASVILVSGSLELIAFTDITETEIDTHKCEVVAMISTYYKSLKV